MLLVLDVGVSLHTCFTVPLYLCERTRHSHGHLSLFLSCSLGARQRQERASPQNKSLLSSTCYIIYIFNISLDHLPILSWYRIFLMNWFSWIFMFFLKNILIFQRHTETLGFINSVTTVNTYLLMHLPCTFSCSLQTKLWCIN